MDFKRLFVGVLLVLGLSGQAVADKKQEIGDIVSDITHASLAPAALNAMLTALNNVDTTKQENIKKITDAFFELTRHKTMEATQKLINTKYAAELGIRNLSTAKMEIRKMQYYSTKQLEINERFSNTIATTIGVPLDTLSVMTSIYSLCTRDYHKLSPWESTALGVQDVWSGATGVINITGLVFKAAPKAAYAKFLSQNAFSKFVTKVNSYGAMEAMGYLTLGAQIESLIYSHYRDKKIDEIKNNIFQIHIAQNKSSKSIVEALSKLLIEKRFSTQSITKGDIEQILQRHPVLTPVYGNIGRGETFALAEMFDDLARSNYIKTHFGVADFDKLSNIEKIYTALEALAELSMLEDTELEQYLIETVDKSATKVIDKIFASLEGSSYFEAFSTRDLRNKMFPYEVLSPNGEMGAQEYYKALYRIAVDGALADAEIAHRAEVGKMIADLIRKHKKAYEESTKKVIFEVPEGSSHMANRLMTDIGETVMFYPHLNNGELRECLAQPHSDRPHSFYDAAQDGFLTLDEDHTVYELTYIDLEHPDAGMQSVEIAYDKATGKLQFEMPVHKIKFVGIDLHYKGTRHRFGCPLPLEDEETGYGEMDKHFVYKSIHHMDDNASQAEISTPVKKTGAIISYTDHDDGYYQAGVLNSYARDNVNEIVIDNITGLVWQDNNDTKTLLKNWSEATAYCEELELGGLTDWRLPTYKELFSLYDVDGDNGWTKAIKNKAGSTEYYITSSSAKAYSNYITAIGGYGNGSAWQNNVSEKYYVRCVRQKKRSKPDYERSKDDQSIISNKYHLIWQDNEEVLSMRTIEDARNYCNNLSLSGYENWRLPTFSDLNSIFNKNGREGLINFKYLALDSRYYYLDGNDAIKENGDYDYGVHDINVSVRCVADLPSKYENFVLENNSTIYDKNTDLMWDKNVHRAQNSPTLDDVINFCESSDYANYNDWRLPNINELLTIHDINGRIIDLFETEYYNGLISSTPNVHWEERDILTISGQRIQSDNMRSDVSSSSFVCVRGGQFETPTTIGLIDESYPDGTIVKRGESFIKEWRFSNDLSGYSVSVVSNSFGRNTSPHINGKTISITLTTSYFDVNNIIVLKLRDAGGNVVKINGSYTFWAKIRTNHAPRLADGQITQLVSATNEPAFVEIETYDGDGDAVTLSIEDDAGGYVGFDPQDPKHLFASFSDGQTLHTIKIGLSDGKEKVVKAFHVLQFNQNSVEDFYTDVSKHGNYIYDGIAFGTLKGVIWGQPDPNDPTKRIYRPTDDVSLAEALKIIINAEKKAELIDINSSDRYYEVFPKWAESYYTYAIEHAAITQTDDLSKTYPTRQQIARILVRTLDLTSKTENIDLNITFTDADQFDDETLLYEAKVACYFGLFMTHNTARPQETINRADLAMLIEKIFMIPTGEVHIDPQQGEPGEPFAYTVTNTHAEAINQDFKLYDSTKDLTTQPLIPAQAITKSKIDNTFLEMKPNNFSVLLNNHGVKNILQSTYTLTYTDTDGDGIPDTCDTDNTDGPLGDFDHDGTINRDDTDDDNDGISDTDEIKYGLNPKDASDATKDSDGDGISNIDEIRNGTDPTVSDAAVHVTLQKLDDLYVKINADIPPITLKGSVSNGAKATYGAVSDHPEIVSASVDGALLTLTPLEGAHGTAAITVTAQYSGQKAKQTFTVTVKDSKISEQEGGGGDYKPVEGNTYDKSVGDAKLHAAIDALGHVEYRVTRSGTTTQVQVTIPGAEIKVADDGTATVTLPTGRSITMTVEVDGRITPHVEGVPMPTGALPAGTVVEAGDHNVTVTIPLPETLTF